MVNARFVNGVGSGVSGLLRFRAVGLALLSFLFLLLLEGCSKKGLEITPEEKKATARLVEGVQANEFHPDTYSAKARVRANTPAGNRVFRANIRMKKDSAIWVSVSPALGIEIGRILLTPDSIKYIDRINNRYFLGDRQSSVEKFSVELDFEMFQELLLGNPIGLDTATEYRSSSDSSHYYLWTYPGRELDQALNLSDMNFQGKDGQDSLHQLNIDDDKLQNALDGTGQSTEVLHRYWVGPEKFPIDKLLINDLKNQRMVEVNYQEREELGDGKVPSKTEMIIKTPEKELAFSLNFTRFRIDQKLRFPFNIPGKYERVE